MADLFLDDDFVDLTMVIDKWLGDIAEASEGLATVERTTVDKTASGDPLWLVRLVGEAKDTITIWCILRQRTLTLDCHVAPRPTADPAVLWEFLLRRNADLTGASYSIASMGAVHLKMSISDGAVTASELDRAIGTMYDAVERDFDNVIHLGFRNSD